MNGDGTIDFDEFKRWYFSGMKSYTGSKRTMLKLGKTTVNLYDAIKDDAISSLKTDLKVRKHKFGVGFNTPENPGFTLDLGLYPVGPRHNKVFAELKGKYADTFKAAANKDKNYVEAFAEVRI